MSEPKIRKCDACGATIYKAKLPGRLTYCGSCAAERASMAAREMAAHEGPAWDKWLASRGPGGRPRGT